jgi:hypothetical protein
MQIHFPDSMRLRVPRGLCDAVQQAARRHHTTPAEWTRQTILRGLAAEGLELSSDSASPAVQLRRGTVKD